MGAVTFGLARIRLWVEAVAVLMIQTRPIAGLVVRCCFLADYDDDAMLQP